MEVLELAEYEAAEGQAGLASSCGAETNTGAVKHNESIGPFMDLPASNTQQRPIHQSLWQTIS